METRMLWQISDTPKITRKLAGFSGGGVLTFLLVLLVVSISAHAN